MSIYREEIMKADIYTDGGCYPNNGNGNGAWAFVVLVNNEVIHEDAGYVEGTTNNRMEMTAIKKALSRAKLSGYTQLVVHSDSMYCINGMTKWRKSWAKKPNKKILNKDLWNSLWDTEAGLKVRYKHVKGHSGVEWNEYVDGMCSDIMASRGGEVYDMQDDELSYLDFRFNDMLTGD